MCIFVKVKQQMFRNRKNMCDSPSADLRLGPPTQFSKSQNSDCSTLQHKSESISNKQTEHSIAESQMLSCSIVDADVSRRTKHNHHFIPNRVLLFQILFWDTSSCFNVCVPKWYILYVKTLRSTRWDSRYKYWISPRPRCYLVMWMSSAIWVSREFRCRNDESFLEVFPFSSGGWHDDDDDVSFGGNYYKRKVSCNSRNGMYHAYHADQSKSTINRLKSLVLLEQWRSSGDFERRSFIYAAYH